MERRLQALPQPAGASGRGVRGRRRLSPHPPGARWGTAVPKRGRAEKAPGPAALPEHDGARLEPDEALPGWARTCLEILTAWGARLERADPDRPHFRVELPEELERLWGAPSRRFAQAPPGPLWLAFQPAPPQAPAAADPRPGPASSGVPGMEWVGPASRRANAVLDAALDRGWLSVWHQPAGRLPVLWVLMEAALHDRRRPAPAVRPAPSGHRITAWVDLSRPQAEARSFVTLLDPIPEGERRAGTLRPALRPGRPARAPLPRRLKLRAALELAARRGLALVARPELDLARLYVVSAALTYLIPDAPWPPCRWPLPLLPAD